MANAGAIAGGALGGAGSGAVAGSSFGPVGTVVGAIGGAVIGGVSGLLSSSGSDDQAKAAQEIAIAQAKQAEIDREQALGFAAPTAQELAGMQAELDNMNRLYTLQSAAYDRDVKIVNAIDPGILSAGQNAYDLMNGKSAPTLKPLQDQITQQRAQLSSQLEKQLGPGYQTSSAGIQALNQFDMNAASTLSQAQQSYMGSTGNLLSQLTSARPNLGNEANQNATTLGNLSQSYLGSAGQIQTRQTNAALGTGTAAYAGAGNVAQGMLGQKQSAFGGQIMGTLATLGSAALGNGMTKNGMAVNGYGSQPLGTSTPTFGSAGNGGIGLPSTPLPATVGLGVAA